MAEPAFRIKKDPKKCSAVARQFVESLRRAQMIRIFRARQQQGEPLLPEDGIGQAALRILLALGLTGPEALRRAPWCASDLQSIIDDVGRAPPRLDGVSIGNAIELSLEERERAKAWHVDCFDKTPAQRAELHRWKKREQKRKEREMDAARTKRLSANGDLSERVESLFDATDDKWRSLSELAAEIGGGEAWLRYDGKCPLGKEALRKALKRAADQLKDQGRIEDKFERALRVRIRLVRRPPD
jgi:hypothetical protein